jgi:rhodanese-related sulfurtransferase
MQHSPKHSIEFEALVDEARSRVREVDADAVQNKRSGRLIDVREDDEWRAGHIAGAEHIGKGVIERDIVEKVPDKGEELILYCGGGYRSVLAADALQKMGYQRVFSMAGGWKAWLAKGYPTEK